MWMSEENFYPKESLIMYHTNFKIPKKIFHWKFPNIFIQYPKLEKLVFFPKKHSSSKCYSGHVESTSDKPGGNFLVKIQIKIPSMSKNEKETIVFFTSRLKKLYKRPSGHVDSLFDNHAEVFLSKGCKMFLQPNVW